MNGLALCSGVGGIELGLRIATRGRFRVVCHVEREAFAAATLVARMADEALDRAPVWDDLTAFDGFAWRGLVDCVTAGIPCQPYSLAGRREGHADERALWPELVRIVEECEPAFVFIENVPAFLKHFGPVWECLSGVGFQFAPPLFQTATYGGAPHLRKRVFILAAHPDRAGIWLESGWLGGASGRGSSVAGDIDDLLADAGGAGLEVGSQRGVGRRHLRHEGAPPSSSDCQPADASIPPAESSRTEFSGRRSAGRRGERTAHPDSIGLQVEWGGWLFDRERQALRHNADGCGPGCRICGSYWETESPIVRVDAGFPERVDQLRAVGNSVVPAMAASAWTYLMQAQAAAWISQQKTRAQPGRKVS